MKSTTLVIAINTAEQFLTHRVHLANEAKLRGYEVWIMCPDSTNVSKIKSLGFNVQLISLNRKGYNPFSEIFYFHSIYKGIKKISPDIYHGFTIKMVIYGTIAARLLRVPNIVNTITGLGYVFIDKSKTAKTLKAIVGFIYRFIFASTKVHVIFQNHDDYQYFFNRKWVNQKQSSVILGTGVDLNLYSVAPGPGDKYFNILFPARLLKDKGFFEVFSAVEILNEEFGNIKLTICGKIDVGNPNCISKDELDSLISKEFIEYRGDVEQMHQQYKDCHVVCLPSYREGIPLALIEAAASGRPIVTTDVPGCREVVEEGVNGFLVKERSSSAVYAALKKLLLDKNLRISMGLKGRIKAENTFDQKIILPQYFLIYKESIKKAA